MGTATTIQEVLTQLDAIIEECINTNSPLGLFAYVYRRTTAEIASEFNKGSFEDNQRLEKMDVAFANLYLQAYEAHKNNQLLSDSWLTAFNAKNEPLTIIQHILLGMNAHINLDLAIATASTMEGKNITAIENDFNKVNAILFQITDEMQDRLGRVSPLLFLLDLLSKNRDEELIDFSMRKAREQAWNSANLLWSIGFGNNQNTIAQIDKIVMQIANRIKKPKTRIIRFVLKVIQKFEKDDVGKIISRLKSD